MVTSCDLKTALMSYYRFKMHYIVADEVGMQIGNADILVDTGRLLIEVETKISRSDLFQGEKRKASKHELMKNVTEDILKKRTIPNQFYIAVPTELLPSAIEWVEKINPNYGVIECRTSLMLREKPNHKDFMAMVRIHRRAKMLHEKEITAYAKHLIGKRLSSSRTSTCQIAMYTFRKNEAQEVKSE